MKQSFLGYLIFVAACIAFSLYVHFPGQTAANYIEQAFSQINSRVTLSIDTVSPSFPVGIKTNTILVKYAGAAIANLDNFKLFLHLSSLFDDGFSGTFKTDLFDGVLSGRVQGALEKEKGVETDARLENLNLKKIFLGEFLSDCEFSGILNGTIRAGLNQGRIRKSDGDVDLSDIVLQFPDPVFSIATYSFSTGKVRFDMPDHKTIKIEDCRLKGRQLDVQSSGDLHVLESFEKSRLNMKARIVLYPLFFMDAGDAVPVEVSKSDTENVILNLRIGGTIQKPIVTVDPGTK